MQLQFEDFKGKYTCLNGSKKMNITRMDLCRCVMQVGYKNYSTYMSSSLFKKLQLYFMIMANVKEDNGELMFKDDYYFLDQSEKVGVSYQIGQGLTKAVAEKYFDIPWVAHFSVMESLGYQFNDGGVVKKRIVQNSSKGKEPDLIGYDERGQIHLFESKGTSKNKISNDSIQKAINQVSNYISVTHNGYNQNFVTRNACYFTHNKCFQGKIIDPPNDKEIIDVDNSIGYLECIYSYYYDFLKDKEGLESVQELGRNWKGYIFIINNKKLFWGVDLSCINFLNEQFDSICRLKNKDEMCELNIKNKEILNFFSKKKDEYKFHLDDSISLGRDGYILFKM